MEKQLGSKRTKAVEQGTCIVVPLCPCALKPLCRSSCILVIFSKASLRLLI